MKTKFQRLILLAAAFIIALFNFSEVALAEDVSSDPPPTIFWLDKAYNTATYLGNGVVQAGKAWLSSGKNPMVYETYTLINLNGEIIFPTDEFPRLEGRFYGDYILTYILSKTWKSKFGLLDRFGNLVVPTIYDTEQEAWAQVGIDYADVTKPVDNIPEPEVIVESVGSVEQLYGYADESGNVLVECQFAYAAPFYQASYTWVNKDSRFDGTCGLLKNPLKKDVISDWFTDEIADADACGLIPSRCAGYYTFEITRSQAAALLVRYLELVTGGDLSLPAEHPFTDTSDAYIEKAYAAGIVQGMAEGIFAPDKAVTREQFATMLYRMLVKQNPDWEETVPEPTKFEDFDTASDWAKQALAVLADKKVTNGISDTKLAPKYYCSTEEAIALVYRLFKAEDKASV